MAAPAYNCSAAQDPQVVPNPDISGIGMVIAFQASAYITLAILVLNYLYVFDPNRDPLSSEALPNEHPNIVDVKFLLFFRKRFASTIRVRIWKDSLEKLVLLSSDQQLISGLALLISGFLQLQHGLSAYHWQMTIYLVWFSSFTHIATITMLRRYLRGNSPLRIARLILMGVLVGLLITALVPTADSNWSVDERAASTGGHAAICFFQHNELRGKRFDDRRGPSVLMSVLLLLVSYITRAFKLFNVSSRTARRFVWFRLSSKVRASQARLHAALGSGGRWQKFLVWLPYWGLVWISTVVRACLYVIDSMLWEMIWLYAAVFWGTISVTSTRRSLTEENEYGFGQCLSIAMLTLFIFAALETVIDARKSAQTETSGSSQGSTITDGPVVDEPIESATNDSLDVNSDADANGDPNSHPVDSNNSEPVEQASASNREIHPSTLPRAVVRPRTVRTLSRDESSMGAQRATRPVPKSRSPATAHTRDFSTRLWHHGLLVLALVESMLVSIVVLMFADSRPLTFIPRQVTWATLYLPLSLLFYALPFLLIEFAPTPKWGWWRYISSRVPKKLRHYITILLSVAWLGLIGLFGYAALSGMPELISVMIENVELALFSNLPLWENLLGLYVWSTFFVLAVLWYLLIRFTTSFSVSSEETAVEMAGTNERGSFRARSE